LLDLLAEYDARTPSRLDTSLETKLKLMKEPISGFATFLKILAQDAAERGNKIIIEPYQMHFDGLRNPNFEYISKVDFLPTKGQGTYPSDRVLKIDGSSPSSLALFDDDFTLLLGGLLADGQTVIIRESDMAPNEMICAFNLPCGILEPNQIIPTDIDGWLVSQSMKNYWHAPEEIDTSYISAEHRAMLEDVLRQFMKVPYAFSTEAISITEWRDAYNSQLSLRF
jgi:hypothetical protein